MTFHRRPVSCLPVPSEGLAAVSAAVSVAFVCDIFTRCSRSIHAWSPRYGNQIFLDSRSGSPVATGRDRPCFLFLPRTAVGVSALSAAGLYSRDGTDGHRRPRQHSVAAIGAERASHVRLRSPLGIRPRLRICLRIRPRLRSSGGRADSGGSASARGGTEWESRDETERAE